MGLGWAEGKGRRFWIGQHGTHTESSSTQHTWDSERKQADGAEEASRQCGLERESGVKFWRVLKIGRRICILKIISPSVILMLEGTERDHLSSHRF